MTRRGAEKILVLCSRLVAGMRDVSGSYQNGFMLLLVLAAVGAIAVSFLPKPTARA